VLVFVFYQYHPGPLLFNPTHERAVQRVAPGVYSELQARYDSSNVPFEREALRGEALALTARITHEAPRDVSRGEVNYIIPRFVVDHLPIGLAGLFIAAVIAAAMNAISGELMSLSTASVVDFYRRWIRPNATDEQFVLVSRAATAFWGLFACIVAAYSVNLGSLIEVVNRFGSFFYGSILGVFLLAMIPRARALGAFVGLIAGMLAVGAVNFGAPAVSFLWHNVIGAVVVVAVGLPLSLLRR
jgi:Na+/proline symporter